MNEDLDQRSLLRKYERELKKLRAELEKRSQNVVDKRRLLELDEQRRRAEQDKMAAIRALEERSLEFMREKEEKRRLEQRIATLSSQMLMSNTLSRDISAEGANDEAGTDTQLRIAMKEHKERIKKEYECRLADLERERETIEEEKAQVDRYKQLLLKQRDIMIALTQRLNERDEQIVALQDELDAYDRHQKELEEKLDEKTAQLIHLQRVTIEHNANSPTKNVDLNDALGEWGQRRSTTDSTVPPNLLITHPQYAPYNAEIREFHGVDSPKTLLSAQEKIKELMELLEQQANELSSMSVEKQALDAALRETKQSTMMQSRDGENRDDDTLVRSLRLQLKERDSQNEILQKKIDANSTEGSKLKQRYDVLSKERRAIQTIIEQKIKSLVVAVTQASKATIDRAGGLDRVGDSGKWLQREVTALNRLVNASIAALRNAANESSNQEDKIASSSKPAAARQESSQGSSGISVEKLIQQRRLQMQRKHA